MIPLILLFLAAASGTSPESPWPYLTLSIERDPGYSSDLVTVCRVRVSNHGSRAWPGRQLRFEARALDGGVVVERVKGRFGLQLAAYGQLETLIGFSGVYDRFEVVSVDASPDDGGSRKRGSKKRRRRRAGSS